MIQYFLAQTKLAYLYISWGDFSVPYSLLAYHVKNLSTWQFTTGAANFDGIMKAPQRLPALAVHELFGSLAASYFLLIFSYVLIAFSCLLFMRYFLDSKNTYRNIIVSLAFALAPVFLGNTAKIGLITAAASVLLCLVCIRRFYQSKSIFYIFLLVLCFNLSLVHPYNIFVNALICAAYIAYKSVRHRSDEPKKWAWKLAMVVPVAILLHLYFILPVLSLGVLDKTAVTQDVGKSAAPDYVSTIYIANAGDPVTALALSKHVFIDFNLHGKDVTYIIFLAGQIAMYALLLALFIYNYKRLSRHDKLFSGVLLIGLLVVIALSSGSPSVSSLLASLAELPGGWIFRSPLKWQLYAPLFLFILIAIQLKYTPLKISYISYTALVLGTIASSSYALGEIYNKLLTPRQTNVLAMIPQDIKPNSRVLYSSGRNCIDYAQRNPEVMGELNQHFMSMPIQVKRTSEADISGINVNNFDYILSCREDTKMVNLDPDTASHVRSYAHDTFKLYKLKSEAGMFSSITNILGKVDDSHDINRHNMSYEKLYGTALHFTDKTLEVNLSEFASLYANLKREHISGNAITTQIPQGGNMYLIAKEPLYYQFDEAAKEMKISSSNTPGFTYLPTGEKSPSIPTQIKNVTYTSGDLSTRNLLTSETKDFEATLLGKQVKDCFAYDDNPDIKMDIAGSPTDQNDKIISLSARNHTACTQTEYYNLEGNKDLFISMDALNDRPYSGGFSVQFNDNEKASYSGRMVESVNEWRTFSSMIPVPRGADKVRLTLYGYPSVDRQTLTNAKYNNVYLTQTPKSLTSSFIARDGLTQFKKFNVSTRKISSTHYKVTITGASKIGLLKMADTYSTGWKLIDSSAVFKQLPVKHIKIDNQDSGWMINFEDLCKQVPCTKNSDGTYNMTLEAYFVPQALFMAGGGIGLVTILSFTGTYAVLRLRSRKR